VPIGRARFAQRLTASQYEAAFQQLWRQSQRQSFAIKTAEAPHYRRFLIQRRGMTGGASKTDYVPLGVNDGKGVMFISHTGEIYPSGLLPLLSGKFPRDHVVAVYQESPSFRGLRDANRLEGQCKVCEFRNVCGGSRARAFAVTGNAFDEEPDCSYIPEAIAVLLKRTKRCASANVAML
jgi:radical SAM protein with 4Fe4S-binding SPASM domain